MKDQYLTIIHPRKAINFLLIASICVALSAIVPVLAADDQRITTSVEIKHVQPLLRRVAHVLEQGFSRSDADRLAAEIRAMPADQSRSWTFKVSYQHVEHPLEVRALLDELGTVDLDFSTSAALGKVLRTDVDAYLNAHNL
jgi:hypothetical protein